MNCIRYGQVLLPDGRQGHASEFGLDHTKVIDLTIITVKAILQMEQQPAKIERRFTVSPLEGFERKV
jgi:hypothetical protein